MRLIVSIVIVVVVIGSILFVPFIPKDIEDLPEDIILHIHRIGGVAGYRDDITFYKDGRVVTRDALDILTPVTYDASLSLQSEIQEYISQKSYIPIRSSLFDILKQKNTQDIFVDDMVYETYRINLGRRTIAIFHDEFMANVITLFSLIQRNIPIRESRGASEVTHGAYDAGQVELDF